MVENERIRKLSLLYNKNVLGRFSSPTHMGEIENPDGTGQAGDPSCGDVTRIYIRVENNMIVEARFKVLGCAAAIASSDMACELIAGKSIEDALRITNEDVIEGLGGLPPEKLHCSVMAEEAVVKAIDDYKYHSGQYYDHVSYYSFIPCGLECECAITPIGTMSEDQARALDRLIQKKSQS